MNGFTLRGECALMRPIGLGESVTGICSRRVLAFPSDRLTHILPLAGHHKSTIITNATHVLGQPLRSNLTDSCPIRTSSCVSVGLMAHGSSIGNIRDLIPFRLPTGQTRQVGRFRHASSLAWMNITTWLHGRKPGERKQVLSV